VFESVAGLIEEHRAVQEELSDPAVHADAARAKRVNRRYAELSKIVAAHDAWVAAADDLEAARELAKEDDAFAEEVPALQDRLAQAQERLRRLLIPRDPDDARDVIMEIKQGEGGAADHGEKNRLFPGVRALIATIVGAGDSPADTGACGNNRHGRQKAGQPAA